MVFNKSLNEDPRHQARQATATDGGFLDCPTATDGGFLDCPTATDGGFLDCLRLPTMLLI